jgi:uncharacterized protein HemY
MKTKFVIMASALLFSAGSFAQKDQLKAADKAIKSSNTALAETSLKEAEALLATDDDRAQFYFLKGSLYSSLAQKAVEPGKNYLLAATAYKSMEDIEKKSGKSKYTKQAQVDQLLVTNGLRSEAFNDYKAKRYKEASQKFYAFYELSGDQEFLFNAANSSYVAEDDDNALVYLNKLKDLNYTGERVDYYAESKETHEKQYFNNKKERDDALKNGFEKPTEDKIISRRGEILKQIVSILIKRDQLDQAKAMVVEARKASPDDAYLALTEANLYYQANDLEMYKKLISQIVEKDPNNKTLILNLGIISYNNKDYEAAENFYKRALQLDPNDKDIYFNVSALKLDVSQSLLDQMNKLGNSAAENKKYEELKAKREVVLKESIIYLEKSVALDPNNDDVKRSLISVYRALDMMDKANALKATIKD